MTSSIFHRIARPGTMPRYSSTRRRPLKLSICSRLLLSMLVLGTFGWLAAAPAGSARTWQVVVVAGDDAEPVFDNATRELSRRLVAAGVPAVSISNHQARGRSPLVLMSQRPLNCSSLLAARGCFTAGNNGPGKKSSNIARPTPRLFTNGWFPRSLMTMIRLPFLSLGHYKAVRRSVKEETLKRVIGPF